MQTNNNIYKHAEMGFPGGSGNAGKNLQCRKQVWSLGQDYPLEKEMATYSSILGWETPRTEELGGLQPMGTQKSETHLSD